MTSAVDLVLNSLERFAPLEGARVGFLIDRWSPDRGGAEAALQSLAGRLSDLGARLVIFSNHADLEQLPPNSEWQRVKGSGVFRRQREASLAKELVRAARDANCDVTIGTRHLPDVDLYWPHGGCYAVAWQARRLSRGRRAQNHPRGRHKLFLNLERILCEESGARRVICVSELVEDELREAYPACADRLKTIHNGVDLQRFHPGERLSEDGAGAMLRAELGLHAESKLVLFSAREPQLKGLPNLLSALASSVAVHTHLLIAGVRRPSRWKRMVRELGLSDRTSFIPDGDPVALSAAADLCVLPTWRDACSLVVLECLASGTPVITTRRNGAFRVITDAIAGTILSDPSDVDAMRQAIHEHLRPSEGSDLDRRNQVRETVLALSHVDWLDALATEVAELIRLKS
ncbi:MAG: glycosyltransferase involved in cell wall biosynthesis [Planctomycetota bacterium]